MIADKYTHTCPLPGIGEIGTKNGGLVGNGESSCVSQKE